MIRTLTTHLLAVVLCLFIAYPAGATFHLMQIEQVIGGVNGDTTAQAIQLRMRSSGQGQLQPSRLRVHDAAGLNPILLHDFAGCPSPPSNCVTNNGPGSRILLTTAAFNGNTTPPTVPDFTMLAAIPASYLAAGSLTFEADGGIVYWRLCWGGAAYTGPTTLNTINDSNGNCAPPFAGPLPSTSLQALKFNGTAAALSTNNAADYSVTAGAATFNNNATTAFVVSGVPTPTGACCMANGTCSEGVAEDGCTTGGGTYQGDNSTCTGISCPQPPGACCLSDDTCVQLDEGSCNKSTGTYQGDGTICDAETCETPCPADIDGNGTVNIDDLFTVIAAWGDCPDPKECPADIDHNHTVDIDDLFTVIAAWGPCA